MWTTADGQLVRASDASLPALRRALTADAAATEDAIKHRFGQIAQQAFRVGHLTHRRSGVQLPVFRARTGSRLFGFVTYPVNRNEHILITGKFIERLADYEDGPGTRIAHTKIRDLLLRSLGNNLNLLRAAVRFGQAQVDANGRRLGPALNKPDVSFVNTGGRRVNVEVDTDLAQSRRHIKQLSADKNARNVFLIIDDFTGKVLGGRVHHQGRERPLTVNEIRNPLLITGTPRRPTGPQPPRRRRRPPQKQPGWNDFNPRRLKARFATG